MPNIQGTASRVSTVLELIHYLWKSKRWWLIPVVILMLPISLLIVVLRRRTPGAVRPSDISPRETWRDETEPVGEILVSSQPRKQPLF
jgi:hypothetical protein